MLYNIHYNIYMYFIKLLFDERFHGCALASDLALAFRTSLQKLGKTQKYVFTQINLCLRNNFM